MASAIPIRNVYYLLCYAWNRLKDKAFVDVSTAGVTELVDLLARVLITGVNRLRRRGLEQGYVEQQDDIPGIRGRIRLLETVAGFQDRHGRATCAFDELTQDTPQNRVIKSAMWTLSAVETLSKDHRSQLKRLIRDLPGIPDRPLTRSMFREFRLHANNRHYGFLINVAELILQSAIPDEATGKYKFRDFSREGKEMARLFEGFVRNFLKAERPELAIGVEDVKWDAMSATDPTLSLLPNMRTDISVRSSERTLIIETKYYEETFQTYYDHKSVHSAHLYQLVAYLRNLEIRKGPDGNAEGMLLYPVVSESIDQTYTIQGHKVRLRTIDLSKEWRGIEGAMLQLV